MMKKGKHLIKSHMTFKYDFTGIRIMNSSLVPVDWNLTVNLVAGNKKIKKEELEYKASIAYQKIYFWLDSNLPNIIAVDVTNEDDLYIANLSSNIMMYCPSAPGDDVIIQMLHAKISMLAGENLTIGEIHLKGTDTSIEYTYDCPEEGYTLPAYTSEYYTEGKTRDDTPWWFRDDGFSFEFVRPEDSEMSDEELFKDIVDPLDEFYRIVNEIDSYTGIVKEPATIVKIEKWKPKKVE